MLRIQILTVLLVGYMSVFGHGEVHERITIASEEIAKSPNDPMLYVKRASLFLEDGDYDETILDIDRAKALSSEEFPPIKMLNAQMYFKLEMYDVALKHIDKFLELEENHVLGTITKAKILKGLNEFDEAAKYYKLAIDNTTTHLPENFMDLINSLIQDNQLELAFEYCNIAQEKFGELLVFQLKAIDIAKLQNEYEVVLNILDEIIEKQPRKERWYFQKAQIFEQLESYENVNEQLDLALQSLTSLPQRIKLTPAMRELSNNITQLRETIKPLNNDNFNSELQTKN